MALIAVQRQMLDRWERRIEFVLRKIMIIERPAKLYECLGKVKLAYLTFLTLLRRFISVCDDCDQAGENDDMIRVSP